MLPIAAPPMPAASGSANSPAAGWFAVPDAGGGSAGTAVAGDALAGQAASVPAAGLGEPVMQFAMLLAPAVAVCALPADAALAADAGEAAPVADVAPPILVQDPQLADAMSQSSELLALIAAMSAPFQPQLQPEAAVATGGGAQVTAATQMPAWAMAMAPVPDAIAPVEAGSAPLVPIATWPAPAPAGAAGALADAAALVPEAAVPVAATTAQAGAMPQIPVQSSEPLAPAGAVAATAMSEAQAGSLPEVLATLPPHPQAVPAGRASAAAGSAAAMAPAPSGVGLAQPEADGLEVGSPVAPAAAAAAQRPAAAPTKQGSEAAVPVVDWAAAEQTAAPVPAVPVVPAAVARRPDTADAAALAPAAAQTTAPIPPAAAAAVVTTGSEAAPVDAAPLPVPAATAAAAEQAVRGTATPLLSASADIARSEQAAPSRPDPNPMERAVANQVSRAIVQHLPDGGTRMVMRLTPPELGTVRVEFLMRDGSISARMLAEDDGVRQALDRALPQIRADVRGEHPSVDITVDRSDQRQAWQDGQGRHEQREGQQNGAAARHREGDEVFSLDDAGTAPVATVEAARTAPVLGGRVTARSVDAFA